MNAGSFPEASWSLVMSRQSQPIEALVCGLPCQRIDWMHLVAEPSIHMLDHESLGHSERVINFLSTLSTLPWLSPEDIDTIGSNLWSFDERNWPIVSSVSLGLYSETAELLDVCFMQQLLTEVPQIAVVIPVYQADESLLRTALESLALQVGVSVECWISVDGENSDLQLINRILDDYEATPVLPRPKVVYSEKNRGVAMCRNLALRQIAAPFFTCLDADDFFHPLRCLHGLLLLLGRSLQRVNTSFCRVSISTGKIILTNNQISNFGHNSFIARSTLLRTYGYLADLRRHEDTEYMRRMEYFRVPMVNSLVVGHYLYSDIASDYSSLSTDVRTSVHAIHGHPYLGGSITAELTEERMRAERHYGQLYSDAVTQALLNLFPGE
jgi:glycosyltransferase involved in cell wall biosynthesis